MTANGNKVPIHSAESEIWLLGSFFHQPELLADPDLWVTEDDFYFGRHKIAFAVLNNLREAGVTPDKAIFAESMVEAGESEENARQVLLSIGPIPHSEHAHYYAEKVRLYSCLRTIKTRAREIDRRIVQGCDPVEIAEAVHGLPDPTATRFGWPDPKPLPDSMPAVATFSFDLLPAGLRSWIKDIADRTQCPPDFPGVGAMVGLASLIGRKIRIRPKRQDDWTVVPNLWGAVIGRPGVMKSPALKAVMNPLWRIEGEAKQDFTEAIRQFEATKLVAKETIRSGGRRIQEAMKNGGDPEAVARGIINQSEVEAPARRRCVVNDSSYEKLGEIHSENENGFLKYRDELVGLLRSLDKEGQECARSFYIESWDGDGHYDFDRISRGNIEVKGLCLSVLGGIQPGPVGEYVRAASDNGHGDDGLMQRFQVVCWPEVSRDWINVDRWPDTPAKQRAFEVYSRIDAMTAFDAGCQTDDEDIWYLRFTPEAQDRFDDWRRELELRLRAGDEHPAFESHLSKYRSLIPSIALICHLVDHERGPVGIDALERAIAWGDYLESHARRLYGAAASPELSGAHTIAKKIRERKLEDRFKLRDVYRPQWRGLSRPDEARRAVEILEDCEHVRSISETPNKKPVTVYRINPRIFTDSPETPLTELTNGSSVSSVSAIPGVSAEIQREPPGLTTAGEYQFMDPDDSLPEPF